MADRMDTSYVAQLEAGLKLDPADALAHASMRTGVGVLVEDPTSRRLVEAAAQHLELVPKPLDRRSLSAHSLMEHEMIVADEADARRIREVLSSREEQGEGIYPAVVVVRCAPFPAEEEPALGFDGVVDLPASIASVSAQLSLILYAHRAFARRYQTALEELHLNRRIFRSVTSGISIANAQLPDLPLTYVNPAFEVMTGYSLEEVLGRNCRFLQGPDTSDPPVTVIREAIHDQREVLVVLKNYRKDGTFFWNELSLSPIRNREGQVTHFVGIQTDVTARVEFEAALRESEKLAAVGRLASSIAHEINNPLESVTNLLYLAQHGADLKETRQYLGQADRELQRVASITSQSLRFYKQSTKPQAISAGELLHAVLDLYESRADNSHVTIERRERSVDSIICLESEIRQVLSNLVRNAIDSMHGSGGRLLVRSREATDWRTGGEGIVITIADTGSGISAQTMRNLYKPFFTTKGIAGTGLGLWISSEIITRHQGRMKVRSSQDGRRHGTVFQMFLPYQGFPE